MVELNENAIEFYRDIEVISDHRYKSWEHCYQFFNKIKNKELTSVELDLSQLHLAFYLASWGMYRGSSFILQKDYTIFKSIIKIILNKKYTLLWAIEKNLHNKTELAELFEELYSELENNLTIVRNSLEKHNDLNKSKRYLKKTNLISPTLITKIILGTIGCIPAYDRFFMKGLKNNKLSQKFNSKTSFIELLEFYIKNKDKIDQLKNKLNRYPIMKLIDMYCWFDGYQSTEKIK
jgi:hypothetical protein